MIPIFIATVSTPKRVMSCGDSVFSNHFIKKMVTEYTPIGWPAVRYYQSKAIAADGQIFIGTPSRFIYSLDAETGEEIWKYEIGAAISGAPVYDNNKIYIGQQGGEDDFYCLDAKTGKLIWKQNIGWVWGSAAWLTDWCSFRVLMVM